MSATCHMFLALGIGIVAGLRSLTAPAVAWWRTLTADLHDSLLSRARRRCGGVHARAPWSSYRPAPERRADEGCPRRTHPDGRLGRRVCAGEAARRMRSYASSDGDGRLSGSNTARKARRHDAFVAIPEDSWRSAWPHRRCVESRGRRRCRRRCRLFALCARHHSTGSRSASIRPSVSSTISAGSVTSFAALRDRQSRLLI